MTAQSRTYNKNMNETSDNMKFKAVGRACMGRLVCMYVCAYVL